MKIDKILMPTDFSESSNAAFSLAVFLARQYQAELHLLHAVVLHGGAVEGPGVSFPDFEEIHKHLEEIAAGEMGRLLAGQETEMLKVREKRVRSFSAAPAILDYAEQESVDLIVLGTHGRRGLRRFLLGSVAEEVVRAAGCPVLAVPQGAGGDLEPIEKIVVPFDFSADSRAAFEVARTMAATYGSRIDLVHVVAPPISPENAAVVPLAGPAYVDLSDKLEEDLRELAETAGGPDVTVESRVLVGTVALQITSFAEDLDADLIVIGSHGLTGLRRFLLGSVAERVVRSAPCPVLVLRHPAEDEAQGDE